MIKGETRQLAGPRPLSQEQGKLTHRTALYLLFFTRLILVHRSADHPHIQLEFLFALTDLFS
jgi:hypothetical protein